MVTDRLQLIPATVTLCDAERLGRDAIASALCARVPASWPPPVFEPDDVDRVREQLESNPTDLWTLHYVLARVVAETGLRALLGVAGYAGPPTTDGTVEIGYAIASEHQRHGYATEAVHALLSHAFANSAVTVVVATTYAWLEPSIGVLRKTGFIDVSTNATTGLVRFERRRDPW
jgi:RimJ/RimL family protein N-acetyltransferase